MDYVMILSAVAMFGIQFLFNQRYGRLQSRKRRRRTERSGRSMGTPRRTADAPEQIRTGDGTTDGA